VDPTRDLPFEQIQPLMAESAAAGWNHLGRLREEWQLGVNRFDREGEAFYLAREGERIVAVGGVNVDPFAASPRVGRVRRVYVLAEVRNRGVGRALLERLVREARASFLELRLRAGTPDAAAFFET